MERGEHEIDKHGDVYRDGGIEQGVIERWMHRGRWIPF